MPERFKTSELCLLAVKQNVDLFWHVPEKLKTAEICLEAINNKGYVFKKLMEKYFNSHIYIETIDRVLSKFQAKPFEFIRCMGATRIMNLILQEQSQTLALLLIYLEPYKASYILQNLSSSTQIDAAYFVATMAQANPELVREVEKNLEKKLSTLSNKDDANASLRDMKNIIKIFNLADRASEEQTIEALEEEDSAFAEEIKKGIFSFEDIFTLDGNAIQKILREVDSQNLAKSLKSADKKIQDKFFNNMSERASAMLKEDMEYMGMVSLKDIEKARQNIILIIRHLENNNEIKINRSGKDMHKLKDKPLALPLENISCRNGIGAGGAEKIARLLGFVDYDTEKHIIKALKEKDRDLVEEINKYRFMFEDILTLDNRAIQKVLLKVDSQDIVKSLKNADINIKNKFFKNMSKRASAMLEEEIESIGMISEMDIKESQEKIIAIIRYLEYTNEIVTGV